MIHKKNNIYNKKIRPIKKYLKKIEFCIDGEMCMRYSIFRQGKKGGAEMENLADKIVMYRAKHRLSQRQFAEKCGLSLQTVNNIETGIAEPTRVTVAKIELVIKENAQ